MRMDIVVVRDPSGDLGERRFGTWNGAHAQVVTLESPDERFRDAVALRAGYGREAGYQAELGGEDAGVLGGIG